jgi:hypothetical protein
VGAEDGTNEDDKARGSPHAIATLWLRTGRRRRAVNLPLTVVVVGIPPNVSGIAVVGSLRMGRRQRCELPLAVVAVQWSR